MGRVGKCWEEMGRVGIGWDEMERVEKVERVEMGREGLVKSVIFVFHSNFYSTGSCYV